MSACQRSGPPWRRWEGWLSLVMHATIRAPIVRFNHMGAIRRQAVQGGIAVAGGIGAEAEGGLVGRASELDQIRLALRRVAGGIGEAMLVTGEAGIGKTRVVAEGATAAVAGGFQILRGAADELEQRRPFGAISDCLALGASTADSRRAATTRLPRDDAGVGAISWSRSLTQRKETRTWSSGWWSG
jgi:hypothetical protein